MPPSPPPPSRDDDAHRAARKANRLALIFTLLATLIGFGLPATARLLNLVKVADFPLGFYVSSVGAITLLTALLLAFAARARRIERRATHGTEEARR